MDKYFCVFTVTGDPTPSRVSFESKHPGTAIIKLMELAKVTTTMQFDEAEILKCIKLEDGKTGYVPVFLKEKDKKKGRAILSNMQATPAPIVTPAPAVAEVADTYQKPYAIEVL